MIFPNPFPNYAILFRNLFDSNDAPAREKQKIIEYYAELLSNYGESITPYKELITSQKSLKDSMDVFRKILSAGILKTVSKPSSEAHPHLYIPKTSPEFREKVHKQRAENIEKKREAGSSIDQRCEKCHSAGCACSRIYLCNGESYFSEEDYMLNKESPTAKMVKKIDPQYEEIDVD